MALPQTKLNCSLSQVRNSASYALKGAVKDTSHSLSGNNYVGAKSFGHDPRKSFQALRYDLNGGRSSIFNMGTRESLNYVAGPTVGPQVYGPSKMQQVTEVITAATGLTKTIFDAIGEINKARGSRSVSSTTGTGSKDNTTLQNEAGNYASNIGSGSGASVSSLIHNMKSATDSDALRKSIATANNKAAQLNTELKGKEKVKVESDRDSVKAEVKKSEKDVDTANDDVSKAEQTVKGNELNLQHRTTALNNAKAGYGDACQAYDNAVQSRVSLEQELANLEGAENKDEARISELRGKLEEAKTKETEALNAKNRLRNEVSDADNALKEAEQNYEEAKTRLSNSKNTLKEKQDALASQKDLLAQKEGELSKLNDILDKFDSLNELNDEIDKAKKNLTKMQNDEMKAYQKAQKKADKKEDKGDAKDDKQVNKGATNHNNNRLGTLDAKEKAKLSERDHYADLIAKTTIAAGMKDDGTFNPDNNNIKDQVTDGSGNTYYMVSIPDTNGVAYCDSKGNLIDGEQFQKLKEGT